MEEYKIEPKVDQTQEFIEIANDFSNPLDLVREAISNSFDAKANIMKIIFNVIKDYGEKILEIRLIDDGEGMDKDGLQAFFDLGNSLSRGLDDKIGEKGHGTKVYFNSASIEVITTKGDKTYHAITKDPIKKLFGRQIPEVNVIINDTPEKPTGTEIIIKGYNNNRRDKFTHELLTDYILWFTKFGSFEIYLNRKEHEHKRLFIKGLNREEEEELQFGHTFPDESKSVQELFEEYLIAAPDYYCKKIIKEGQLKKYPEITYQALFSIEGNKVKLSHNPMLRRPGKPRINGDYTVQERYGVWLSKDFIPIQRKNEWITYKGSEYIKFHAFFNCQELKLTANRGSVDNTPSEILEDIRNEIKEIYNTIVEGNDWTEMTWLEQEADAYRTSEKERKDFDWRKKKILKSNIYEYKGEILVEPERESGVFALTLQLNILEKGIFPFHILDYDTHSGVDIIAKGDNTTPITSSALYYVEFKYFLTSEFNHSFSNLHSIVCWDTTIKHNEIVIDLNGDERKLEIIAPESTEDYTRYYLTSPRSIHRIEVFVLKDYLKQRLNIDFRPRTEKDVL